MANWFILSLSLNEKVSGDWVQLRLWPTGAPRTSKLIRPVRRSDCRVYSRNWPVRVKWAPFCNFRGPFFKKRGARKGAPNPNTQGAFWDFWHSTWVGLVGRFADNLEHSGQLRKPRLELYRRIPDVCLVKWWLKIKKKRKVIDRDTVRGHKSSK